MGDLLAAGSRPGLLANTLMTAPSDEALQRDVELVKSSMGFNGVRKHQK